MKTTDKNELLFVVDKDNNPLKPLKRCQVHGFGIWHRVAHVLVFDSKHSVLCHRRSLGKDSSSGKWAAIFGGHLDPSESNEHAAIRELFEESGIEVSQSDLKKELTHKMQTPDKYNYEFQAIFSIVWDGDLSQLVLDKNEVIEAKWLPVSKVLESFKQNSPKWAICGYETKFLGDRLR